MDARGLSEERATTYQRVHNGRQNTAAQQKDGFYIVKKAPSSWRRDGSEEPGDRVPRNGSQGRFQLDNPHLGAEKRARSTSINPVVYPSWWGEADEVDPSYYRRRDHQHIPKRLLSAEAHKGKVYKPMAKHCEDTLDRRLRQVHEGSTQDLAGSADSIRVYKPR